MRYVSILLSFAFFWFCAGSLSFAVSRSDLFSQVSPTPAVEYNLPYAGLLPDHPLYFLKALRDRILLLAIVDPVKKVELNLLFADKRLVMGKLLWEKGSVDLSTSTISKAEKYLLAAAIGLDPLKKKNPLPPGLADKLDLAAKKHEEIINSLLINTADETKKQNLNQALGINHQAVQQIHLVK